MPARDIPAAPTEKEVDAILGEGAGILAAFLRRNPELRPEWKYYGSKHGWGLKLFRKKRNMCFIGHEPGALAIMFILGDRAFERLVGSELSPELRERVQAARRFPEGHGIRLILRDESSLEEAQLVLDIKRTV